MRALAFMLAAGFAAGCFAQNTPPPDPLGNFIMDMFKRDQGDTLCTEGPAELAQIRATLAGHFKGMGIDPDQHIPAKDVAIALWTRYPCPFSPYRPELRPAKAKDIEGVWLFPEGSQKYRFGPRSGRRPPPGSPPVRCDAVGYYPNGELRHAVIAGQPECPFRKAADLDSSYENERVASWSMLRDGRVSVARTDVEGYIEEWDVFVVIEPFQVSDLK
ncbi:MAG TPA: hypothetical protein VNC62_14760, partial [Burkholderiales bacterium]|nr:hypothetical protein [Burkholderiales bacterium]